MGNYLCNRHGSQLGGRHVSPAVGARIEAHLPVGSVIEIVLTIDGNCFFHVLVGQEEAEASGLTDGCALEFPEQPSGIACLDWAAPTCEPCVTEAGGPPPRSCGRRIDGSGQPC